MTPFQIAHLCFGSLLALGAGTTAALADSIAIKNGNAIEEYAGRVVSANAEGIVFDVECSGDTKSFAWGAAIKSMNLNDQCSLPPTIGAGGFDDECDRHKFLVIDSMYEVELYATDLNFQLGVLTLDKGGYDIPNKQMLLPDGSRIPLEGDPFRLTVSFCE